MSERLEWPAGFERTPADERESYPHGFRVSRTAAFDNILKELRKMDARNVQVKTAAPHTQAEPHRPYADRDPDDPGVVVYFERDGQQFAVPCDRWDNLRDNAQAIAKYLNAKRALDRYGVQTVESEFSTQALPSADEKAVGGEEPPYVVLDVEPDASEAEVRHAFREKVKDAHPDNGGSATEFQRVRDAYDELTADNAGGSR
ncbi:J domain-containing protein [Halopiger goleimassiliensis]|uniref:J domain-containing protein n=1 Tax=Halopiger goleimassiliensis TaxID=1293048 RepID=UPI0006782C36|nr:J domain-containing protein [Halopiger goleimassiliensis]